MSLGPFFRNPFTDFGASLINHQHQDDCAKMELDAVECLEAYGMMLGVKKCEDLLSDFYECHTGYKKWKRYLAMQNERRKQISAGILTGDEKFGKAPKIFERM